MSFIAYWLITALVIIATAYLLPGVTVTFGGSLLAALVLGILNATIKPILVALSLPLNILTLGLFTWVINALLILLASAIVPGFKVANFWWALLFSFIVSLIGYFVNSWIS